MLLLLLLLLERNTTRVVVVELVKAGDIGLGRDEVVNEGLLGGLEISGENGGVFIMFDGLLLEEVLRFADIFEIVIGLGLFREDLVNVVN